MHEVANDAGLSGLSKAILAEMTAYPSIVIMHLLIRLTRSVRREGLRIKEPSLQVKQLALGLIQTYTDCRRIEHLSISVFYTQVPEYQDVSPRHLAQWLDSSASWPCSSCPPVSCPPF